MLNSRNPFELPGFPDITLFSALGRENRFYFIRKPHIARDEQNRPQINLLLYGRKQAGILHVTGGQLSLGTSMALLPGEEEGLRRALEKKSETASIELAVPDWRKGSVRISLTTGFELESQPSLLGGNEAVFIKDLSPQDSQILKAAWERGLPDASISYNLETDAVEVEEAGMGDRIRVEFRETRAAPFHVSLEAPIRIPPNENLKFLQF